MDWRVGFLRPSAAIKSNGFGSVGELLLEGIELSRDAVKKDCLVSTLIDF